MLEKAVSEAQSSESRVQNFQNWIYRVDELLNDHLDNDTTMEDLPHDFQVLKRTNLCTFVNNHLLSYSIYLGYISSLFVQHKIFL